jgi:hypothetical protein
MVSFILLFQLFFYSIEKRFIIRRPDIDKSPILLEDLGYNSNIIPT